LNLIMMMKGYAGGLVCFDGLDCKHICPLGLVLPDR
jgi:hypothetical protein